MSLVRSRTFPAIIEDEYFDRYGGAPNIYTENPEGILAKENAVGYLKVIKDKIKFDHFEEILRIETNHQEIMQGIQANVINNYISGLESPHRLAIVSIESTPFVEEDFVFGFKIRAPGVTLRVKLR